MNSIRYTDAAEGGKRELLEREGIRFQNRVVDIQEARFILNKQIKN
jgi:hypothetical protein